MISLFEILRTSNDPYTDVAQHMYGPRITNEQRTTARLLIEALCRHGPYIRHMVDVLMRNGYEDTHEPIARLISVMHIDYPREHLDEVHRSRKFKAFLDAELACFEVDRPVEDLSHHDLIHLVTGYRDLIKELRHRASEV